MFSLILLDLTLREVLSDIPHDAGAIVVYLVLALFIGFTVYGSRKSSGSTQPQERVEETSSRHALEPHEQAGSR